MKNVTMKKLLVAGLVVLAPSASMAADNDDESITVKLGVTSICDLGTWSGTNAGNSLLDFTSSLAGDARFPANQTAESSTDKSTCNYGPVKLMLKSNNGAMIDSGVSSVPGFTNELAYGVSVSWSGESFSKTSSGDLKTTTTAITSAGAITGSLTISVTPDEATDPMLPGGYSDTLMVFLQPN
jgi:hypothetical protein